MRKDFSVDPKNFSQMVLMALLTNPEDGKSDNYMIQQFLNYNGEQAFRLVAIDNDHAFVPSILKKTVFSPPIPFVKTILFCFDQMWGYVHEHVIDEFLELDINSVISGWIIDVEATDNKYRRLFSPMRLEELYLSTNGHLVHVAVN